MALCIVVGIALGHLLPAPFQVIGRLEVAQVNLPVAALTWLMIVPMLLKIDVGSLHPEHWSGIGVTLYQAVFDGAARLAVRGRAFSTLAARRLDRQGEQILKQPLITLMLTVPILIQVYFNSGLAYLLNRSLGVAHCVAALWALIGGSNFFKLAVATAIVLFGFNSGTALATVVGELVEVPVMLSVVRITTATKGWYERGLPAAHQGAPAHLRR